MVGTSNIFSRATEQFRQELIRSREILGSVPTQRATLINIVPLLGVGYRLGLSEAFHNRRVRPFQWNFLHFD